MGAVDQRVGCGVEILTTIEKQELGIGNRIRNAQPQITSVDRLSSSATGTTTVAVLMGQTTSTGGQNATVHPSHSRECAGALVAVKPAGAQPPL